MGKSGHKALLALLFVGAFISAYNENIINVAILDVTGAFGVTYNDAQWLVTGYMIVTTVVTTMMAFAYRRFELRKLFVFACLVLVVGSALCLVMPSFPALLACRLVQAVGTGVLIPCMMNTVLVVAPRERVGSYLAIGGACITLGPAFGPVLSGVMVTAFGWRAIFAPALVVAAVLGVGAVAAMKVDAGAQGKARLDALSVALSAVGLTLFVYGLNAISSDIALAAATLVVGVAVLAAYVIRQFRLDEPMMNLRPMERPSFSVACVLVIIAMMTTFSMSVLLPLYFEGAFGTTALAAGALVLPPIAVNAVTSVLGGRMMDRFGEWPLLPVGFALIVAGQAGDAVAGASGQLVAVIAFSVVVYAGVGLVLSPSQAAGLKTLSRADNPHGVAIISTIVMIAAAIGPSLFVGILSAAGSGEAAVAAGFGNAVAVAAVIGAVGLAVSIPYSVKAHRRDRDMMQSVLETED